MHSKLRRLLQFLIVTFVVSPVLAQVLVTTLPVGQLPVGMATNRVTNTIYVANLLSNTISVINGATYETTSIPVGVKPLNVAVNEATNKIYVFNLCGSDPSCTSNGTVTVVDGATLSTHTMAVGSFPFTFSALTALNLAVNSATNKIYVATCGSDSFCASNGTLTVIDGATLATTTVPIAIKPSAVAVNEVTNTIYVVNQCGNDPACSQPGTVTVIDGATLSSTTVTVGMTPSHLAVNPVTNEIYVANSDNNTVTLIDGATLAKTTIHVGIFPFDLRINPVSNKIYVANLDSSNVTVIDGATHSTATVTVGSFPSFNAVNLGVDPVINKIYVATCGNDPGCSTNGTLTVIDGLTLATTSVSVGINPIFVSVNPVTNRIYVANWGDATVSVIAGPTAPALQFVAVTPCRLVDTRDTQTPIQGGTAQSFPLPQEGACGSTIPPAAAAYSLNVTVVPHSALGYLTIWPTGQDQPVVSTMNSLDGRIKANAAIVPSGYQSGVSVFASNTTDLVLDIDGYFAPSGTLPGVQTYQLYTLIPCRVIDTRGDDGPLGGPFLSGGAPRNFPLLQSSCMPHGVSIQAYSLNFTVVPHRPRQPLGYLTVWPQGQDQPVVSTLNNLTATTVANAAIVPAGTGGGITTFASNDTDLVVDVNGYFAAASASGLSLYPVVPCRVLDTRGVGDGQPFSGELTVNVAGSTCAPSNTAQGYVFNATVVPSVPLGYLSLWPDQQQQPVVSTLNALDGFITSNMAIVPTNNGSIDAFASNPTQLVLDISSYFAP